MFHRTSTFTRGDLGSSTRSVFRKKYHIILADMPWPYTSFGTAKLPYPSIPWEKLKTFPWQKYCAKRCVIFLWTTGPLLDKQIACYIEWAKAHKFRFLGVPYKWIKTTKDGIPIRAAGPRATLVKPLGEDVIAFTNVRSGRPFPLATEAQVQWVFAPKPIRGEHSRKPLTVHDNINKLFAGNLRKLELFGREAHEGWHVLGNQAPNPVTLEW